jgi:hypothetical protein
MFPIAAAVAASNTLVRGGAAFDPLSLAIFAAMDVQPDAARMAIIDTFIRALVAAGVWDLLDVLYVFAAHTEQAALLNWINPGPFDGMAVNAPTFTVDEGFTGNGSTAYIDTGFNPTTAGGNYVMNSACRFARIRTAGGGGDQFVWGQADGTGVASDFYISGGSFHIRTNANGTLTVVEGAEGFIFGRLAASDLQEVFKDGVLLDTVATEATLPNGNLIVLRGQSDSGDHQLASHGFGAALNDMQQAALYTAELAYMQAVGAVP